MISRIWHGWTTIENADAYEYLLLNEILPGIKDKDIDGYLDAHLLREDGDFEVEFITICWFRDWRAVEDFAGQDSSKSVVPVKARKLLKRFDDESAHYQVLKMPQPDK